jgi:hypothetical protein
MNTACDTETCATCHGEAVEGTNNEGECRSCETFAHNLKLMAAGITRDKKTGRYTRAGE